MKLNEAVRGLAILRALEGIVKAEIESGKDIVTGLFNEVGAKSADAKLADGTTIATVSMTEREGQLLVTHDGAFEDYVKEVDPKAWVKEQKVKVPAHVETVEAHIDPDAVAAVKARLKRLDDGNYLDPETGAVVPGVKYAPGSTYPGVRFKKGGKEAILEAWQSGGIDALLTAQQNELPAGGE